MRTFIQYDPGVFLKDNGVCIGSFIKSELKSSRVPGKGPGLPPHTVEVTDREQEGLDLGNGGWMDFAYDSETETFTKFDPQKVFPETTDGRGGNP